MVISIIIIINNIYTLWIQVPSERKWDWGIIYYNLES